MSAPNPPRSASIASRGPTTAHLIADGARRDAHRRGGGRHRQDHRAGRAYRPADPDRTGAPNHRDRRGDVQREGRRRAQAAAARGARAGAHTSGSHSGRLGTTGCRRSRVRRGAHQHDSRLLCGAAARAPGRGGDRSVVSGADRDAGGSGLRRGLSRHGWRRRSRIPAKVCGDRCAVRRACRGGATPKIPMARSRGCAGPAANCCSGAITPLRGSGPNGIGPRRSIASSSRSSSSRR